MYEKKFYLLLEKHIIMNKKKTDTELKKTKKKQNGTYTSRCARIYNITFRV